MAQLIAKVSDTHENFGWAGAKVFIIGEEVDGGYLVFRKDTGSPIVAYFDKSDLNFECSETDVQRVFTIE